MKRKIQSYNDLLRQERLLNELLHAQKELMAEDLAQLSLELKPAASALHFLGKITSRDRSNFLLNEGADRMIDVVVKKLLLSKAGWLARLTVPFFLKNYSSHVIAGHKDEFLQGLLSLISKKHSNGKAAPEPVEQDKE